MCAPLRLSSFAEPEIFGTIRGVMPESLCEVSSVFYIPKLTRMAFIGGKQQKVQLRYAIEVQGSDTGEAGYIRSHGVDFHIIPPEWLDSGLSRIFSIGPGFDSAGGERLIVLVQAFASNEDVESVRDVIGKFGAGVVESEEREYDLQCWRLSALLPGALKGCAKRRETFP
jgi:hypothetical protein